MTVIWPSMTYGDVYTYDSDMAINDVRRRVRYSGMANTNVRRRVLDNDKASNDVRIGDTFNNERP